MSSSQENGLLHEPLSKLLRDIGSDGGILSPSIYDSALTNYFMHGAIPTDITKWLLGMQRADGSWGDHGDALYRVASTLAALVGLQENLQHPEVAASTTRGLEYLRADHSFKSLPDADLLPIGVEIIAPFLLEKIESRYATPLPNILSSDLQLYRRKKLSSRGSTHIHAGSAATYSFEAWGKEFSPKLVDESGGLGHSPTATAMNLALSKKSTERPSDAFLLAANAYLSNSTASVIGSSEHEHLYPVVWPIRRFEILFSLYALHISGLIRHEAFEAESSRLIKDTLSSIREQGYSWSDYFQPDADDTAAALIVLHAAGYSVNESIIGQYFKGNVFYTYEDEINPSLSSTARSVHASSILGNTPREAIDFIEKSQQANGLWKPDKWNISPYYSTLHCILALLPFVDSASSVLEKAKSALILSQNSDGGWSSQGSSNPIESAYAALSLIQYHDFFSKDRDSHIDAAIVRAGVYLERSESEYPSYPKFWLSKELYSPIRVDRAFHLCALIRCKQIEMQI